MNKKSCAWLLGKIRQRIPVLLVLTGAQTGNALLGVLFALGSRNVIDCAVLGDWPGFYTACLLQICVILGILVCLTLQRHLRDKTHTDLERDWKRQLLHGLLHGEYAAVSGYHSAELLNRMNNDVEKVNEGILSVVPGAAAMLTRLAAAIGVMGLLDAWFTAIILFSGLLVIFCTSVMRRKLKALNKQVSFHDGKVSGFLQETMEKLLLVQAMDVSAEVEKRADLLLNERYHLQRKRKNVTLLANTGISLMSHGAAFLALVWCSRRLLLGQMSVGSLTAVIQLVNQLQAPFVQLSGVLPQYVAMVASAERLMELEQIQGREQPAKIRETQWREGAFSLCARDLRFSYDQEVVLKDVNFTLPKGAFVVVTGPSGIGKSTMLKLLLGIYPPDSGELYLESREQKQKLDRSTRKLFAYVPQGNFLFSGTLRENLLLARPDATEEQIRQAIYVSAMDAYLPGLPLGLDTPLGENAAGLSEGQAQRLSIARAVLGGAPILLLDEATSALDEETEAEVLGRLRKLSDRTCIAVTHRPAAMKLCDWHLEVSAGNVRAVNQR